MKMFATGLLFVMALLACSLPDPGCDDHSCDGCKYVLKAHAEKMIYHLGVECPYDSACNATLVIFLPVPKEKNECKMDNFEYTLVSGNIREKMEQNTNLRFLPISSDDHFRFSLFDSAMVEKKNDIDLSSIIHSYTIDGDSVRITLPYSGKMKVSCPICQELGENCDIMSNKVCQYINESDSSMTVTIGYDWDNNYRFSYGLSNQGPLGSDTIDVGGRIYFRE